uniref:Coiled-coil domain-containing protein 77 n=1 Tax=Mesocestoides corti TaxID=53468 RepID=A0A5K3FAZ7_MESCO
MAAEQVHVNQTVLLSERRLSFLESVRAENIELQQLATALADDMAKAVCEYNNAYRKYSRLSEDCQLKMKQINRQLEEISILEAKLAEVSKLYTAVKLERNKCVSLLQAALQVSADTRERLRQRSNEGEILLAQAQKREMKLMRMRKEITNLIAQRDHKRHDLCKVAAVVALQNSKREQMLQTIDRLNLMYNQSESSIIALKKACERNARLRNERAILLIERNQEVYLLQEREKSQSIAMT